MSVTHGYPARLVDRGSIRDVLLSKLMSGEIDVSNLDL